MLRVAVGSTAQMSPPDMALVASAMALRTPSDSGIILLVDLGLTSHVNFVFLWGCGLVLWGHSRVCHGGHMVDFGVCHVPRTPALLH